MIVDAIADVEYHKVVEMMLLKVVDDILDAVSIYFLEKLGGGKGHGDNSIGDVGEVKLLTFMEDCFFRACDDSAYDTEHNCRQYDNILS